MPTLRKISLSLLLSTLVFSQEMKLDDLVQEALVNSPDIKISKATYKSSSQRTLQADADYLPQVNLSAEAGKQSVDYKDQKVEVGSGQPPLEFGRQETDLLLGSVTAKQLIYDFGKTTGNMEDFEYQEKASKSSMTQTISNKIFAVKKSYYSLLAQHALVKVNKEDLPTFEALFSSAVNLNLFVLAGVIIFLLIVRFLSVRTSQRYLFGRKEKTNETQGDEVSK